MSVTNSQEERVPFSLVESERCWRDQYELLLKHGYELRPRFRPGWTPSWTIKKRVRLYCEDGYANHHPKTIDARRISDGRRVKIKKLVKGSKELEIARFLTNEQLLKDSRNHCIPILDVFSEEHHRLEYMVMPLLITYQRPPFSSVDEVLDFMEQTLEGLSFMHEHGVAHRDCSVLNIMMDGDPLFPKGFHPSMPLLDASAKSAHPRRRRDVSGVKYYFIDFGISTRFNGTEETRLVTGGDGQDQDVPELHKPDAYDPFPVDVFILGNVFLEDFLTVYENLSFLEPLAEWMTQQEPKDRPTPEEALRLLEEIIQTQPPRSLRWALVYFDGSNFERLLWNVESLAHEALFSVKSVLSFPRKRR